MFVILIKVVTGVRSLPLSIERYGALQTLLYLMTMAVLWQTHCDRFIRGWFVFRRSRSTDDQDETAILHQRLECVSYRHCAAFRMRPYRENLAECRNLLQSALFCMVWWQTWVVSRCMWHYQIAEGDERLETCEEITLCIKNATWKQWTVRMRFAVSCYLRKIFVEPIRPFCSIRLFPRRKLLLLPRYLKIQPEEYVNKLGVQHLH